MERDIRSTKSARLHLEGEFAETAGIAPTNVAETAGTTSGNVAVSCCSEESIFVDAAACCRTGSERKANVAETAGITGDVAVSCCSEESIFVDAASPRISSSAIGSYAV